MINYKVGQVWKFQPNQHTTKFQRFLAKVRFIIKRLAQFAMFLLFIYAVYFAGQLSTDHIIVAQAETIAQPLPAVMLRIAKCESNNSHYENGQVLVRGNTNKSVDIGKFQINQRVWSKKATELHLDLFNEKDNETFALYLYHTLGTEPWYASRECWNR